MLANFGQVSRFQLLKGTSGLSALRSGRESLGCVALLWPCLQRAHSVQTPVLSVATPLRPQDLKIQILRLADNIKLRYEVDQHKVLSEAALGEAEKAIGYAWDPPIVVFLKAARSSAICSFQARV